MVTSVSTAGSARPFGPQHVTDRFVAVTRSLARILGVVSLIAFLVWRIEQGIPPTGSTGHWEALVQIALLVLAAIGNLVSWRWEMTGATIMAVAGLGLAVVLAFDHDPTTTIPFALLFFAPAGLHWLAWQRHRPLRQVVALGAAFAGMLGLSVYLAFALFDFFYGPAHPQSEVQALPPSAVEWVWSGAVTEESATVKASLDQNSDSTRADASLVVATDAALEHRVASIPGSSAGEAEGTGEPSRVVMFPVDGLDPDTIYHYAVQVGDELDTSRAGTFRTFPDGAGSFSVAVGSCARLGSNGAVFDEILANDPLLYLIAGDWFYGDIGNDDREAFRADYETTLTSPAQSALYRSVPIAYMWDDHDYGPDEGDSTSAARPASEMVYRELVPHYPLGAGDGENPIYQAFTVGRVRFILMDARSARSPKTEPDGPAKTMLGDEQQEWLESELLAADEEQALTVLVSSVPWIAKASPGSDDWAGYATERRELADFIAEHHLDRVVMVGGDAHMIAIDDGTHSNYSAADGSAFPVLHAGALDRHGSEKGGPYSEGAFPGAGHFGLIDIDDDGSQIDVTLRGLDWTGEEVASYQFTVDSPAESRSE
jgi:phosphodiesterase/alkaline phosphatase D-like protein